MTKKVLIYWFKVYFDFYLFYSDFEKKIANKRQKIALELLMLVKIIKKIKALII